MEGLILQYFHLQKYEMLLRKSNKYLLYYKFTAFSKTYFKDFLASIKIITEMIELEISIHGNSILYSFTSIQGVGKTDMH